MKYVAEKVLERALTFTRLFYMNRNSGLTTLSDSSIALSEDEKKAGEGQGSKKLQEFDGLGTKKKKVVTIIILHS